jgi:type II secretory pathway pseudopilin PulG
VWLLQASADAFTPSAIILALAGVISTLGALLLRGWQERVKRSEEAERTTAAALLAQKDAENAYLRKRLEQSEERNRYLEDDRAESKDEMAGLLTYLKGRTQPPRKDSPPPTTYSMQTSSKKTHRFEP